MDSRKTRYFILVGDIETWKVSLDHNIWGFSERSKGYWNTANIGDHLAFYVTSPVKKVIGFGRITSKFVDDSIIFPDERIFGKAMWLYKLGFIKLHAIENWDIGITVPSNIMLNVGRKVIDERIFLQLVVKAEQKWNHKIMNGTQT